MPSLTLFHYRATVLSVGHDGLSMNLRIDLGFGLCIERVAYLAGLSIPSERTKDQDQRKRAKAYRNWLVFRLKNNRNQIVIHALTDPRNKWGRLLVEAWWHVSASTSINTDLRDVINGRSTCFEVSHGDKQRKIVRE